MKKKMLSSSILVAMLCISVSADAQVIDFTGLIVSAIVNLTSVLAPPPPPPSIVAF